MTKTGIKMLMLRTSKHFLKVINNVKNRPKFGKNAFN